MDFTEKQLHSTGKDMGMDAVDEKQQREIDSVRRWVFFLALFGLLLVVFAAIFASNREIQCPHPDCPHSLDFAARHQVVPK